jgi:hypothetical protein
MTCSALSGWRAWSSVPRRGGPPDAPDRRPRRLRLRPAQLLQAQVNAKMAGSRRAATSPFGAVVLGPLFGAADGLVRTRGAPAAAGVRTTESACGREASTCGSQIHRPCRHPALRSRPVERRTKCDRDHRTPPTPVAFTQLSALQQTSSSQASGSDHRRERFSVAGRRSHVAGDCRRRVGSSSTGTACLSRSGARRSRPKSTALWLTVWRVLRTGICSSWCRRDRAHRSHRLASAVCGHARDWHRSPAARRSE